MLRLLIEKELRNIISSPKFALTFGICSLLIVLSVYIGIEDYRKSVDRYTRGRNLVEQEMLESTNWMSLTGMAFREPNPLQIFAAGVNHDIGRFTGISAWEEIKLRHSNYQDEPLFAVFRFIDFTFIVQIALSLLAILFTYDSISGEREQGTLKLTFSNAVPRTHYILSKFAGAWLGLAIPLAIPVLIGFLLLLLYRIPVSTEQWMQIMLLLGTSVLFFTFFIAFGILISTLTRHTSSSFLILLVSWVMLVLIIPRAAIMLSAQIIPVPTVAETESKQAGFEKEQWESYGTEIEERYAERNSAMQGMTKEQRDAYEDENMWAWLEEEDSERKKIQANISEYHGRIQEGLRNRRAEQERLAFKLSRFSPAAAYQLAVMNIAGTNIDIKTRYEDAFQRYRLSFVDFIKAKQKESGQEDGLRISISSEDGIDVSAGEGAESLDLSELPRFQPPRNELSASIAGSVADSGLLMFYTLISIAAAFTGFLRYDVR